jgi:hypothetical protein
MIRSLSFLLPCFSLLFGLLGCASSYQRVQIGNPALPSAVLAGSRWEQDRLAYLTRILAIDGTPTGVEKSIWKDVDAKTDFNLPAGRHVLSIEVREHATFNEACRAYGRAEVEVNLAADRRYYLRSTFDESVATTELMDLTTFEAAATFPSIPLKRGVLGLPAKL